MSVLRPNLLAGRRIVMSGPVAQTVSDALLALDAELEFLAADRLPAEEERVGEWARSRAPLNALVHCAAGSFGGGGREGLDRALEETWAAVREVATGALIESQDPAKLVLVAPRPEAGPLAGAARAGLENLARTLSVEWARYGLTAVAIAPGSNTTAEQLALLVCFVVSAGGDYLSGCRLELGGVR
jgi:NAD(P)-dependent dehydrogenase (short-subunit alcohol dehydrogenase family)